MQCQHPQSAHVSHLIPKTDTHSLAYVVCLCPCQRNVTWDSLPERDGYQFHISMKIKIIHTYIINN